MYRKKNFDVLGILLGLILGCLLGFFVSNSINKNTQTAEIVSSNNEYGYIYILQIAKFDNPTGVTNYKKNLDDKGLECIIIEEDGYYYIYGHIETTEQKLIEIKTLYESKGYEVVIKKEFILDYPNKVIEDKFKYDFWVEGINNLLKDIEGKTMNISEKYYIEPVDLEFFSSLTILNSLKNQTLKNKVRLQAYKYIKENLK